MALSEHISISAKRSKKLQVEQHLFPLQPASAISLSQEVLPDTEQSHSGIVFVNLWQELSTFFIYIKKKTNQLFLPLTNILFLSLQEISRDGFWTRFQRGDRVTSVFAAPLQVP